MGKFLSLVLLIVLVFLTVECDNRMPVDKGVLVSTDWLQSHLKDPGTVLLHAGTEEGFDSIHIPGARLIFPRDFVVSNDSMRNELPALDSVVNMLRMAGVNQDSRIILCYEDAGIMLWTARVFVTLEHAGLAGRTFVLNGGLPAWLEEERETTDVAEDISMGNLETLTPVEVTISTADLQKERWLPDVVVIDTRTDEEYRGTPATAEEKAEGGHVEGAYFLPYQTSIVDDTSYLFKSDAELEKLFLDSGMDRNKTTVVYCGSGIRASVSYLTARQLGYTVLLYDGSYQEWDRLDLPLTGPVDYPSEK